MKTFALRLKPDRDLKQALKEFVYLNNIQSGYILTAVGSLKQAKIRFAARSETTFFLEKFEIVSLVGTLSLAGIHLHIALANRDGKMIGGHLDNDCLIYTTAEIVIGESENFIFTREVNEQTGFKELIIMPSFQ
ncbi:DNA-binding protein [Candidatus Gracilibacteria bacterium]|nr:DNA-binding protein [Candidatus Gracilibacteria bacterium]NJM86783.1 DNA-binding protein [Hydrococcus sp. RU_2_2]